MSLTLDLEKFSELQAGFFKQLEQLKAIYDPEAELNLGYEDADEDINQLTKNIIKLID